MALRCLQKEPEDRFQSARELAAALDRLPAEATPTAATPVTAPGGEFAQDIFISYAHLDNEAQLAGQEGWVSAFHRSLEVRVGQLLGKKPVIWRDLKRHGVDTFDETNRERIPKSALLITVLSPRYVKSEFCHRELQEFMKASSETGGPKWGSRFRVFKVVKTPTPVERHPPEIQPLMPGLRLNPEVNDEQLAAILTYVRNAWGNAATPVATEELTTYRESTDVRAPWPAAELMKRK